MTSDDLTRIYGRKERSMTALLLISIAGFVLAWSLCRAAARSER